MQKRIAGLILFILATIALGFQRPPADNLPSQISDDDFWQMINTFSEKGGDFVSENYVSNEWTYQTVIPEMRNRIRPGGVYLGVAPEQNFTYIAAIQAKIAFIIDIRRKNMLELLMYKALFEISANRAEFVGNLFSRPLPSGLCTSANAQALFARRSARPDRERHSEILAAITENIRGKHHFPLTDADLKKIKTTFDVFGDVGPAVNYNTGSRTQVMDIPTYYDLMIATDGGGRNWSYLETEERFQYIKNLEDRNLIIPVVGDFSGPKALRSVARFLAEHGATVSLFYVSNVEDYLRFGWDNWFRNVAALPTDPSCLFIRFIARQSLLTPMVMPDRWPGARGNAVRRP